MTYETALQKLATKTRRQLWAVYHNNSPLQAQLYPERANALHKAAWTLLNQK